MAYNEQYISDHFEDQGELQSLIQEIVFLGFDPIKEIPTTFSHYQITEGFDLYDQIKQRIQINTVFDKQRAIVSFTFRAIQDHHHDIEFRLVEIQTSLFIADRKKRHPIAEKSFDKKQGLPTKMKMIQELLDNAKSLTNLRETAKKIQTYGNTTLNTAPHRKTH
jgi:hypothetical protein